MMNERKESADRNYLFVHDGAVPFVYHKYVLLSAYS